MGNIAQLRGQFNSINTYDYIITLIKRRKKNIIYLMRIVISFEETWIPLTLGCYVQRLVEIGPVVLKKKTFLILSMYFR